SSRAARIRDAAATAAGTGKLAPAVVSSPADARSASLKVVNGAADLAPLIKTDAHNQIRLPLPGLEPKLPRSRSARAAGPPVPPAPPSEGLSAAIAAAAEHAFPPIGLLGMATQPEDLISADELTREANLPASK